MDLFYWYLLSCSKTLSDRQKYLLVKRYGGAREIFEKPPDTLALSGIIGKAKARKLLRGTVDEERFKGLVDSDVRLCTINDRCYPDPLREIYDPPVMLYYKGELPECDCVAIIGSRKCSSKGKTAAKNLASSIAAKGITVSSGMARGIDSFAHKGALITGSTIAVLGCGIDICYPPENHALMKEIEKNGCLVSELPPGEKPTRYTFPRRNRIISGISKAVVVVEAGLKSGALITVDFAIEQGRDVYAVDWPVKGSSPGTEKIIYEGATPLPPCI